jgi:hypothetical protein
MIVGSYPGAGLPLAAPIGAPAYVPGVLPPPVDATAFSDLQSVREEEDYTYWRDSGFKVPFLLLIIAVFVSLFALTAWQANSDLGGIIKEDQFGQIPRRLEIPSELDTNEGGVPIWQRDIRVACFVFAIVFAVLAIIVFFAPFKPVARSRANIFLGVLLFLTGILAWVCFGADLNNLRDAENCSANPNYSVVCESRDSWLVSLIVWDAGVAVFAMLSGILLIAYSRSGDWTRQFDPKLIGFAEPYGQLQPGMYPNGVSFVRKWLVALSLLTLIGFAILMIVFTILLVESREKLDLRDQFNRPLAGDFTAPEGWREGNSLLRYAVSAAAVLVALICLIPFNSRVIAYVFGFIFLAISIMSFTVFGLDVDQLTDAHNTACPRQYTCVYHEYNATAALDFIGAILLLIFIVVEYFVLHRRRNTASAVIA